jgi:hypothetical protein
MATVEQLWSRLEEMEKEKRFAGESYPQGMCSFPFKLQGQGFFPGGDGLWRGDQQLQEASSGILPTNGMMFVGNDFGTLATYVRLKGFENPPTWKNLKKRVQRAELPERKIFCTNAIVGLRIGGTALEAKEWSRIPGFLDFCREFFVCQVEMMAPRLIVVMGPIARTSVETLIQTMCTHGGDLLTAKIGGHATWLMYSSHPYGDFNLSEQRRDQLAASLKNAWQLSDSPDCGTLR